MAGSKKTLSIEMRLRDFASKNLDRIRGKTALMAAKMVKGFKKVGKAITSVKGLMIGFIAVLAVRRVTNFALGLVEMQDKLSKMARSIGSTTEELSALQFAFERSGLEIQKVEILLTGFGRARSQAFRADAAKRVNDQVRAFQLLGVSIQDLRTKGAVRIFEDLADGLERVAKSQGQTALQALFPDNFLKLFPLLSEGGQNFRNLIKDAERFGAVISTKAGKAAEKFVDTMTNFKSVTESVFRDLVNKFLPDIQAVLERVTDAVINNKDAFIGLITGVFQFIKGIAEATFANIIITFEGIASLIGRTRKEAVADLQQAQSDLSLLMRNTAVFSKAEAEELNRRRKASRERVKSLEKEVSSFRDLDTELAKLSARIEEFNKKAKDSSSAIQTVEMTAGFREASIAIRDAKNELVTMNEEGKKLLDTARQLEALPAAFIGPTRPGQVRTELPTTTVGPVAPPIGGDGAAAAINLDQFLQKTREVQKTLDDLSIGQGFQEGIIAATSNLDSLGEAGFEIGVALKDGLVGAMDEFIEGTLSAKEAVKAFGKAFLRQIAKIIQELIIANSLQSSLTGKKTIQSPVAPGPGTGLSAAKGGVFPEFGGRFAGGGIVPGRSQLINVGEGGRREAVIPLDDNRAVPVDLRGTGGFNITNQFFFQGSSGESLEQVRRNRAEIVAIINRSIQNNEGGMRRTIQEIGK